MSGFNVVKFTVKDGMDNKFLSDNKNLILMLRDLNVAI